MNYKKIFDDIRNDNYDELDRKKDIFHFGQDLYKDDQEENQIKDYKE